MALPLEWIATADFAAALTSALVGGVFQSFSDFVMRGLVTAQPQSGVDAMQRINKTVFRSAFLTSFLALGPATLALAAYAWAALEGPARDFAIAGALIYNTTVIGVTMFGNVPMNDRLDRLPFYTPEAADYWRTYGRDWTRLNDVRTVGSVATAICFLAAGATLA